MAKKTLKISKNIQDTSEIAKMFLGTLLKNNRKKNHATVVGLSGDLGAGKTAFTQEIAKHLKIKHKVNSPTFVIMKKYPLKFKEYKSFFHLDAYRLKNEKELLMLGWEDITANKENLIFIEWPENVGTAMPASAKFVRISIGKNNNRNFKFK